jgi:hypothetical protein
VTQHFFMLTIIRHPQCVTPHSRLLQPFLLMGWGATECKTLDQNGTKEGSLKILSTAHKYRNKPSVFSYCTKQAQTIVQESPTILVEY